MDVSRTTDLFLEAATAIDETLRDRVIPQLDDLRPAEAIYIYEMLSVTMAFNTIGLIMSVAADEQGGRRASAAFVENLPHTIRTGLERAIAAGLEARASNPSLKH